MLVRTYICSIFSISPFPQSPPFIPPSPPFIPPSPSFLSFSLLGIPSDHPESYHTYMWQNFFKHIDIEPVNVHILDGQASDLQKECDMYEEKIKAAGGVDLFVGGWHSVYFFLLCSLSRFPLPLFIHTSFFQFSSHSVSFH